MYLTDMSGDGLADLVRIRNGEACYWRNLGYESLGPKVVMDDALWLAAPGLFDQRLVGLADIDGSQLTDLACLGHNGVWVPLDQAGNRGSAPHYLTQSPKPVSGATFEKDFPPIGSSGSIRTQSTTSGSLWTDPRTMRRRCGPR